MMNVGTAFELLEHSENIPVGWNVVTGHIIFDVRWISLGHRDGYWTAIKQLNPRPPHMLDLYTGKVCLSL